MSNTDMPEFSVPDPAELSATMAKVAERSQRLIETFAEQQREGRGLDYSVLDTGVMTRTFQAWCQQIVANPQPVIEAQIRLWQDYAKLWQTTAQRFLGHQFRWLINLSQAQNCRIPLKSPRRWRAS